MARTTRDRSLPLLLAALSLVGGACARETSGDAACAEGTCASSCADVPLCIPSLEDACELDGQCCGDAVCTGLQCVPVTYCLRDGYLCSHGGECCTGSCAESGGLLGHHVCGSGSCALEGSVCATDEDCCTSSCDVPLGLTSGTCSPRCRESCTTAADCCAGDVCSIPAGATRGTCAASPCAWSGASCLVDADCCAGTCDRAAFAVSGTCTCGAVP